MRLPACSPCKRLKVIHYGSPKHFWSFTTQRPSKYRACFGLSRQGAAGAYPLLGVNRSLGYDRRMTSMSSYGYDYQPRPYFRRYPLTEPLCLPRAIALSSSSFLSSHSYLVLHSSLYDPFCVTQFLWLCGNDAMLSTCRRMYEECKSILYSSCVFPIDVHFNCNNTDY